LARQASPNNGQETSGQIVTEGRLRNPPPEAPLPSGPGRGSRRGNSTVSRRPGNVAWVGFTTEQTKLLAFRDHLGNNGWARNSQSEAVMPSLLANCEAAALTMDEIRAAMASVGTASEHFISSAGGRRSAHWAVRPLATRAFCGPLQPCHATVSEHGSVAHSYRRRQRRVSSDRGEGRAGSVASGPWSIHNNMTTSAIHLPQTAGRTTPAPDLSSLAANISGDQVAAVRATRSAQQTHLAPS
jgi:hypothetical protein